MNTYKQCDERYQDRVIKLIFAIFSAWTLFCKKKNNSRESLYFLYLLKCADIYIFFLPLLHYNSIWASTCCTLPKIPIFSSNYFNLFNTKLKHGNEWAIPYCVLYI